MDSGIYNYESMGNYQRLERKNQMFKSLKQAFCDHRNLDEGTAERKTSIRPMTRYLHRGDDVQAMLHFEATVTDIRSNCLDCGKEVHTSLEKLRPIWSWTVEYGFVRNRGDVCTSCRRELS